MMPKEANLLLEHAADSADSDYLETLLNLGGFPEPLFNGSEAFWRRWSANHRDLILSEDLRDVSRFIEIDKIEALLEMITPTIGNTVSYSNLARDLETSHSSVKRWLEMLERLQLIFSISPYAKNIRRSYLQEKKWYYVDWRAAEENIFENHVAASLSRAAVLYSDRYGEKMSLHFIRTHDGAEVDFLLCKNKDPWLLVEAKLGKANLTRGVHRFSQELGIPCVVVSRQKRLCKKMNGLSGGKIFCLSWSRLGRLLP
jgi:predicted AAA+ superfamily ATPase